MQSCRYDQSAYISYLVDEAVRVVDNSDITPTSTQNPQILAPSNSFTPSYPVDFNFPRHTGAPNFPPFINASFNPQLSAPTQRLQLYSVPAQQNFTQIPGPAPNSTLPSSYSTLTNSLSGQQSQFTINSPRYQTSSFCLNQHIGLEEPPVVNASQINNKIQVQFQFGDNDRFSVQSTNTTESNGLDTNWNNFGSNVSENQATTIDLTIPTSVQPGNVQTKSKCLSNNSPADFGDFSQFCVSNILGKNAADIGNSTNVNRTIENTENVRHDSQAEAREYFNYFMQKEKEKEQLWKGSERSYNKSVVKYKPNSKTIAKRSGASKDTSVNIPNKRCTSTVRLPVNVSKVANEVKTVEDTQSTEENNRDSHEFSNLYYKEYLKLVKKQKAEKDNSKETVHGKSSKKSVPVKKRRSKVAEPSEEIKLLKLTYQCGDCLESYDNIKDLKKHIRKNHKETKKAGEGISEHQESGSILVDLTETEKIDKVDLTETEEIDEVSMTRESEEQEIMEVESENTNNGSQSYLCSYCGYDSKSKDESEEHQKTHKDELERDTIEIDCHREETEYFQMSQKLVERQKEGEEERKRKGMEERNRRDDEEALAKAKASEEVTLQKRQSSPLGSKTKKVSDKKKNVSTLSPESAQEPEDNRTLPKRRAATQAKNTLMNPSKGKQKRIRDTRSLNTEDTMLMERFGIIPSKVCLSRVQESENLEPPSLNSSSDDLGQGKRREKERNLEGDDNQITTNTGIEKNHLNENMNMSNTENVEIVNSLSDELGHERNDKMSKKDGNLEGEENQITRRNKVVGNHWNKVLNMCNIENAKENTPDMAFSDDDSDIEIVEPPMTLIVLDDEVEETATKKESPKKSDKEILKSYGLKDVTINMDKVEKSKENDSPAKDKSRSRSDPKLLDKVEKTKEKGSPAKDKSRSRSDTGLLDKVEKSKENRSPAKDKSRSRSDIELFDKVENSKENGSPAKDKSRSRSDTELLEKFGIKDLSVNLTNTQAKVKHRKPGPKSKTQTGKRQTRESKSSANAAAKNIEEMSPNEIEKLLYECGMGISVPVQSQSTSDNGNKSNDKTQRTPSPVPSTSKGHGHLKRKRTARKSTKDSALFKEYKLKDSKVIIQNLSRIDVSLIRNPNSPFGKSDWLKHKFDSDSESDFEFDIPTPPLLEDFVENTGPCRSNLKEQTVPTPKTGSPSKTGRKSPVKRKGLKAVETFGITDQVVVADSQKRKETSKAGVNKKKTLSDEELRRKFGIPNTMVVINTPEKTQGNIKRESSDKTAAEKTPNYISFADFKSALDSARKNILSRMKTDDFSKKEIETENELPRKTRRRADNIEENVVQSPKRHKVEVTRKFKENIKTESDSPRKTRRKADDIKDKDVHSLKKHKVEVTGNVKECRDTDVSLRKTRRKANNVEVVHSLKRNTVTGKLNKNFELKDNKKGRNEKETYAKPNVNKRNLRPASQLNERLSGKILPSKLKTLTVDIHKLKLNEALKTYKAKAVSRAIEARHKKNKNLREVNKGNAEQINIHNERTTSSARKRSRSKEPDILSERSVKRKCVDFKDKPKGIKQLNFERQIQVVKTARYRRAVPEKETVDKPVRTCDFKKLTKGLPVVKVTVPCLTNEDILRLSQSTEETKVSSSQVASQIVYEIIDKICFAEEVPDETVVLTDSDSEICERNANCTSIEGGESNSNDNSMKSVPVNSGEVKHVQESSNEKENIGNKEKESSNAAISTDESESDLSLISVTFENKGNENNVPAPFCENKDDSGENKNIDTENDNDIAEMEKTSVNKIDVIPLGKSKFYDEDLKEISLDEVDGDIVDGTEMSLADDDETALNIIDEKEKNICEMKTKHKDTNLSTESLNDEDSSKDDGETIVLKTCTQGKTARMVDCIIDETEVDDASAEKENRSEKENSLSKVHYVENVEKELNDIEVANTLNSYDEGDVNDSKDNSASAVKRNQVLSAIIDSESGSLIGDVYSVDESAGSSSGGGPDKTLHKKENDSPDCKTDNCSRASRSRSTTPDDVIETITES